MTDSSKTTDDGKTPKFDGEFDAERAARLVANLREDLDKARTDLKAAQTALQTKEDAEKTEVQKATDRAAAVEAELKTVKSEAMRERIARKHNLPDDLAAFLSGDSEEEVEAKAKSLASYAKKEAEDDVKDDLPAKPKTRLVPGHTTDDGSGAFDPQKVADAIRAQQ